MAVCICVVFAGGVSDLDAFMYILLMETTLAI